MKKLKLSSKVLSNFFCKIIIAFAMAAIICSCSAQWHLRKAIKKDPGIIKYDTVTKIDTTWIRVQDIDTVFRYTYSDTVIIQNRDSVIVKYFYNTKDSTVYLSADCPDCPQIKETNTVTEVIRVEPSFWEKIQRWIGTFLMAGIIIFLITRLIRK